MAKTTFEQMKKEDLLKAADLFGVEVNPSSTNKELITLLKEDGVTVELFESMTAQPEESKVSTPVAPVDTSAKVLVKMERKNHSVEVRGHKYTQSNPFHMVSEEDAEYLIHAYGGFRPALQSELVNYYG